MSRCPSCFSSKIEIKGVAGDDLPGTFANVSYCQKCGYSWFADPMLSHLNGKPPKCQQTKLDEY